MPPHLCAGVYRSKLTGPLSRWCEMTKEPQLSRRFETPSAAYQATLPVEYLYADPLEYQAVLDEEYPTILLAAQLDAWEGK